MHECLVKFALLLQDRGQIRMRSGELWKHFQSFQIQGGSLLNKALFTFDIRQIIERIRMIWTQPEKEKKTCFRKWENILKKELCKIVERLFACKINILNMAILYLFFFSS